MTSSHSLQEDLFSLGIGVMMLSFAIVILKQAGVLVGGVAGLALLVSQLSGWGFGLLFFAISAPFYLMAWFRMSRAFTLKSLATVGLISWLSELMQNAIAIEGLSPLMAGAIGGVLCGVGLLVLFRHHSSAGGFNVLALYCQERFGLRAGYLLMGLDGLILLATAVFFGVETLMASTLCIVLMNLVLGMNHRPGRYLAQPRLAS
ncbi:YitT family protein [Ferrimonas balearica]|uniref:YitT family protein n=1 Tax=Ferrimonas balearica TaxID=44012 RepID=UPI001C99CF16|nr:YitT family protein [Ferrimonas balearica]MBY5992849.1 YitT family protein [Ferrimonas balearica]